LKTAWALCDAGIVCWEAKYRYQLLRPDQYIRQHIQHNWAPLHAAPPFPSFPSGHATFGAAAAEVLTAQLGEHFRLTDRTHEGRAEFASMPRSFRSFEQMAEENAFSRVLMGVHYRMDCEEGLRLGKAIGQKISRLHLHWHEAAVRQ
ncbi:MAG TPA: vanadium-dependent haloperoxidase, partial [Saprospiraceae bacterium]|nr:vanadium-dependent haloperoxidase [Saprospiraceae bacterium]